MNKTVTKTITIGEALPKEIERCQEILADYASIGAAGLFGSTIIKQRLAEANKALASGDLTEMIIAYGHLQTIE